MSALATDAIGKWKIRENRFLHFQWRNILNTEWSVNRVERERLFKFINLDFAIGLNKVWTLS